MMAIRIALPSTSPPSSASTASARISVLAKRIRDGLTELRETPEELFNYLTVLGYDFEKAADMLGMQVFAANEGELTVNSNLR